jgi:hypothetical protein
MESPDSKFDTVFNEENEKIVDFFATKYPPKDNATEEEQKERLNLILVFSEGWYAHKLFMEIENNKYMRDLIDSNDKYVLYEGRE